MVDMKNRVYNDPDDFILLGKQALFPCNTQYMTYNPMLHRYTLTIEGLIHHNVDISTLENDEAKRLAGLASKKLYDYIQYKSGPHCYHIQMYRIATAPNTIYPNQYFMRKQFEEALVAQAKFLVINGDSAQVSTFRLDADPQRTRMVRPEEDYRDASDIAPEAIRTLETLGLTRWFRVSQMAVLNPNEY